MYLLVGHLREPVMLKGQLQKLQTRPYECRKCNRCCTAGAGEIAVEIACHLVSNVCGWYQFTHALRESLQTAEGLACQCILNIRKKNFGEKLWIPKFEVVAWSRLRSKRKVCHSLHAIWHTDSLHSHIMAYCQFTQLYIYRLIIQHGFVSYFTTFKKTCNKLVIIAISSLYCGYEMLVAL